MTRPAQIWRNCESKVFVGGDDLDRLIYDNDCSTCAHWGCCLAYWEKHGLAGPGHNWPRQEWASEMRLLHFLEICPGQLICVYWWFDIEECTILARQGSWRKWFAPTVEVACASPVVQANLTTVSRPLHLRGKAWAYQNQPIARFAHPVLLCASTCLLTFVWLMLRNNWVDSRRFSWRVAGLSGLV